MRRDEALKILGFQSSDAPSEQEIKLAYRTLALEYHPDKHSGESGVVKKQNEEKFKQLGTAYEFLTKENIEGVTNLTDGNLNGINSPEDLRFYLYIALYNQDIKCLEKLFSKFKSSKDGRFGDYINEELICIYFPLSIALMQAKDSRNYSILELLLENGADPNIKLLHNQASLYYYTVIDDSRIVELLLQYGADPNMLDRNGRNPLSPALFCNDDSTVEVLLKYGCNPNMLDRDGKNPLYKAICYKNDKREKNVELLLKCGADPNQKVNGSRVIECAPYFTNNGVMNLIKTLTLPYGSNDKVKGLMAEYGGVDRRYLRDQTILTCCCLIVASATFFSIASPLRYVPTAIFALAACFFIKNAVHAAFFAKEPSTEFTEARACPGISKRL
ncbi:ankyrin repeat domain-containing protein [Wolbachia endosymbiont (group B) of Gerris lacustris]|uniref:ankyrin repeat domain-containing protein n=1 Tax=Wolbachia endosymbiont (group B) of Gerris lacustris TaxID=3066159 RepID=UPI003341B258